MTDFLTRARALRLAAQPAAEVLVIPTMVAEIRVELDKVQSLMVQLGVTESHMSPSIRQACDEVDRLGLLVDTGKALREDFTTAVQRLSAAWLAEIRRVQKGTP